MKALSASLDASNPTKSGAEDTVKQAETATKTLSTDLKALGKPETAAGQQAKDDLSALAEGLSADVASIQTSISGTGALSAVATASDTLSLMGHEVAETFGELQKLGAKGELEKAFSSSASCKQFAS